MDNTKSVDCPECGQSMEVDKTLEDHIGKEELDMVKRHIHSKLIEAFSRCPYKANCEGLVFRTIYDIK
jgi:hypothetical protein